MPVKKKHIAHGLKIGYALGGGGARGLAHIGVIKVLEQAGIFPDLVVGTSMGAIVGALYCHFQDAAQVEKKVITQLEHPDMDALGLAKFQQKESEETFARNIQKTLEQISRLYMLTSVLTKDHIIAEEKIQTLLSLLLPEQDIESLAIPFAAVASDLLLGKPYVFTRGPIRRATQASAAIPGVFRPVVHDNRQLVDGAITSLVPVTETFAQGATFVIAIDVSPFNPADSHYKTGLEIFLRADQITGKCLRDLHLLQADAVVRLNDLDFEWFAFNAARAIIKAGEDASQQSIANIVRILQTKRPWWQRIFR
ncbi:patatin-like phospholipase family protein [bacterium]|nr:patatin-like phospholipase family protein [bacterium]